MTKESTPIIVARIEQKLSDFIDTTNKELQVISDNMKAVSESCNHAHTDMCNRIADLETQQKEYKAVKADRKEKASDKYQKLREYSLLVGFTTSATTIILFLLHVI